MQTFTYSHMLILNSNFPNLPQFCNYTCILEEQYRIQTIKIARTLEMKPLPLCLHIVKNCGNRKVGLSAGTAVGGRLTTFSPIAAVW
jgi:hypothetical protein